MSKSQDTDDLVMERTDTVTTWRDADDLVIGNTNQRLPDDVAQALAGRRSTRLDLLKIEQEDDFSLELRQESSELRRRVAHTMAGDGFAELDATLRDAAMRKSAAIAEILEDRITRRKRALTAAPKWRDLDLTIRPTDHSFWWAETNAHVAPSTRAEFRDDGLHFWGGPKVNDYDGRMHTSLGAVAHFILQPNRFPSSPSGMFRSSPHIELFGGVVAYAPNFDLIQGEGVAECKLFLRQSVFQLTFGPTGPATKMVAEAQGHDAWHILLKNTGFSRHLNMPGFKPLTEVTYSQGQLAPNDLHAEIEFRLDIFLNCTGALVWCDPEVLFRTFQWAPTPV
jgi:hypothetical protein